MTTDEERSALLREAERVTVQVQRGAGFFREIRSVDDEVEIVRRGETDGRKVSLDLGIGEMLDAVGSLLERLTVAAHELAAENVLLQMKNTRLELGEQILAVDVSTEDLEHARACALLGIDPTGDARLSDTLSAILSNHVTMVANARLTERAQILAYSRQFAWESLGTFDEAVAAFEHDVEHGAHDEPVVPGKDKQ